MAVSLLFLFNMKYNGNKCKEMLHGILKNDFNLAIKYKLDFFFFLKKEIFDFQKVILQKYQKYWTV